MSFACHIADVADALSQLSISDVTVKDKDQIVMDWIQTANVLFPLPAGWITDFAIEYDSLLQGTNAPSTISYVLTYRFLGTAIGDPSTFPVAYSALVDKLILIINAIVSMPAPYSGRIEMQIGNIDIGPKIDPAGNNYFGADIPLRIKEMQN